MLLVYKDFLPMAETLLASSPKEKSLTHPYELSKKSLGIIIFESTLGKCLIMKAREAGSVWPEAHPFVGRSGGCQYSDMALADCHGVGGRPDTRGDWVSC